eukprot:gene4220-4469_t
MAEDTAEFPGASAGSAHSSRDKAFEIFVKRTITNIQKEAWGRGKEVKEIREACQAFLNTLEQSGCTEETLKQVLYPLQLACASSMQKVVELALSCLHKLVAHAWLHGESAASGAMDILTAHGSLDDDDTVANVIKMVIKCGDSTNEALQLSVLTALLTFTTAEHFIAHGECLLAAVRAVFNLALGSENPVNKRTACNALLQMLNTICRRVTQIQPRPSNSSECSMRTASDAFEMLRSVSTASFSAYNFSTRNSGSAFCKLASREAPGGGIALDSSVLAQGKLLALEMLAKVLSSSYHSWDHVSELFCKQLRQPLCLALLRNCAASDPGAYALALRLLTSILCLPRLRFGLRAELGAFYPLLVLRVLEQGGAGAAEQANVACALGALQGLLGEPQLLVDLFVNYDCDLQTSNLFERTVQVVNALEVWAKPIRDAALRTAEADGAGLAGSSQVDFPVPASMERDSSQGSLSSATGTPKKTTAAAAAGLSEAERLAAAKSTKELMAKGIHIFNSKGPLKGLDFLMCNGLLGSQPAVVAGFLRGQQDQLDKAQLGELLGHHEDFSIGVMHAWIDSESSMAGEPIDQSLRRLLGGFRLPGEAQKIDRIMEKFAERYCKDNPKTFSSADAAYVLSFAIIMLNTDAHNPLAERRLAKADFVSMNQQQHEEGGMYPVLPVHKLEEIYERVVREEIVVRGEVLSNGTGSAMSRASTRNRLAAAMGWTALLQPFRALAGSTSKVGKADNSSNAVAQRRYLQEMAEREVLRAAASGNVWCCASHPEHVRPMLQVGGPMLLQALSAALAGASDPAAAAPVLAAMLQLAKLSGLLGLDRLCEACVTVLAANCGAFAPEAPGSVAEAKQLATLQALLGLTAGPEASFLGSSWVVILRCVSAVDALKHELTRPVAVPVAPVSKEPSSSNPFSRMLQSMFGNASSKEPQGPCTPVSSMGGAGQSAGGAWQLPASGPGTDGSSIAGSHISLGGGIAGKMLLLATELPDAISMAVAHEAHSAWHAIA